MTHIRELYFNSIVREFTVFIPLKHGTRWLSSLSSHTDTFEAKREEMIEHIYNEKDNPFGVGKIKIQNFKRTVKVKNPVFVYRDPYEVFTSAIITGLDKRMGQWDGTPSTLDERIVNNHHFSPTLWRDWEWVLSQGEVEGIEFVPMENLTKWTRINTLKPATFDRNEFTFDDRIAFGYTKDEIIELCKKWHPQLWFNFMKQIEADTLSLHRLLEKYKWNENKLV